MFRWKLLVNSLFSGNKSNKRKPQRRKPKARVSVEQLESRVVPSTIPYGTAGAIITQKFAGMPVATAAAADSGSGGPTDLSAAAFPAGFGSSDGLAGWYVVNLVSGDLKLGEGEPSTTTGALWDFNNGNANSQALGSLATSSVDSRFGAIIENTTGKTLTQFTLSYTGEEWWEGTGGGSQQLDFGYLISSSAFLPSTANSTDTNLNFAAPKNSTATATALDGTLAANQTANIHDTVTGLTWNNDTYLIVYWNSDTTGKGDGMAVANLAFSAAATPFVTSTTDNLPNNATSMTINGSGFDTNPANDTVTFSNGVTGSVTAATATSLTVTSLSGLSTLTTGTALKASVTVDGASSGTAVQVATVAAASTPTVTSTADSLPSNATSMTINGTGFDTNPANDVVTFSNGVTGTVTGATTTALTVTSLNGLGSLSAGTPLNASVSVDGISSGTAVQVGTLAASSTPTVTASTASLADNATSMTIYGTGFDTNPGNDFVTFDNGVAGTVTSATTTSLTVTGLTELNEVTAGTALNATVRVYGVSSGSAVQVATVNAQAISYSGSTYTQNFSSLPSGNAAIVDNLDGSGPYDLTAPAPTGYGASGVSGWYAANIISGASDEKLGQGEPTTTTGALFDFNDAASPPAGGPFYALGTISTSSTSSRFGAIFENNSSVAYNQFTLSYTGEEWWQNSGSGTALDFSYEIETSSPGLPTGTSGFTPVSSLDYTVTQSGSGTALDGGLAANQTAINSGDTPVTGFNWLPGDYLVIFWDKGQGAGTSAGLGVSNVSFSAALVPTVTPSTTNLPTGATSMTIAGTGFDANPAHDTVTFSNGVTGTVTAATATSLTVTSLSGVSSLPIGTALKASVTIDGYSSGTAVQVATIVGTPTVTSSTDNLPSNATSMTIAGTDFDVNPANDVVTFSNGVTGTVTAATSTLLTVTSLGGLSTVSAGTVLNASVTVDGVSSGSAVQVATVATASTPTVTASTASLLDNATSITIAGTGFDSNAANDSVTFDNGVTGTITGATATSLTVGSLSGLGIVAAGTALNASVTVDGVSSGNPVQVATVAPVTISYSTAKSTYTQTFSTLPDAGQTSPTITVGTGSPVQGPYDLTSAGALGASGLNGWYAANIAATPAPEKFAAGEPNTTTGALYDFNDGTAGSQALGMISTGTTASRFGALLVNNTGATMTQFTLSYTGEEWWDNSGTGTALNFSYQIGATGLPTSATAGTTVASLGFTAPDSSDSGTYVDGFTTAADQVSVSGTVTGISWAPGQTLAIFWDKGAGASTSDGLGVANVSFSAAFVPTVTTSTANLPKNATSMTISGSQFDTNPANDKVFFSMTGKGSVTGTVTAATPTSLTVSGLTGLSSPSIIVGTVLKASVTVDGSSSGTAVPVATVAAASTPTVTTTTHNLPSNATVLTIAGTGFDTNPANDVVTFSNGVTGTVTSATATTLTVSSLNGVSALSNGTALKASVTVFGVSSGTAVQVGTVAAASTPTVTSSTVSLPDNAASMTIAGTGFDTIAANNVVTFSNGVTGTVTAATATSLTVSSLSGLNVLVAGTVLNASVAVFGVGSGTAVQVATVTAVTIGYSTAGSNYTQNFSTLPDAGQVATPVTGTGSPVQGPYDLTSSSTGAFGAGGLTGWYGANLNNSNPELFAAGESSTTTGALYDFNDGAAGSQALGMISTGATASRFGALFVNNTANTLNVITLSYTGEEWWDNSGTGTALNFSYEVGVTSLPTSVGAGTTVAGLGFIAPDSSASGTFVDGFTTTADQVSVSGTATGVSWAPGQTLAIFWDKGAGDSASDGLGIANLKFSANVLPAVTSSTGGLPKNATSMTINGTGFDTNPASDVVTFSNGVTGTVTAATSTTLTVSSLSGLSSLATGTALNASVKVNGVSSGSAVEVASVAAASTPSVTSSTHNLPSNATSMTIAGTAFATNPGSDVVTFSNGVSGTVTAATATSLTVSNLTGLGTVTPGTALNASVAVFGVSSGTAVQVATVAAASTPTVTSSTAGLMDNATSITINGTGFDTYLANDSVTFDNGVTGTITGATATSLTVAGLSGLNVLTAGTVLNASVTVDGVSSGSLVPVATVVPVTIAYSTAGSTYTQNFSTLPDAGGIAAVTDGTGSNVQGPYDLTSSSTGAFGASGLNGWYAANIAAATAPERFAAGEPTTTTGALYDFNDGTAGSQALGMISTTTTASRFGALFVNNTGGTLNEFSLSYTGEQWWVNSGSGTSLNFSYAVGVTGLPTSVGDGTAVSALGFTAPQSSDSGSTYVDGFTTAADQVSVIGTVTGINWAPGQTLAIFWDKGAGDSSSDGLGITNVSFKASGQNTPTVSVTDPSGTYNGQPFAATNASVTYNGTTIATFGSPTLSYQYYQGGTLLASAPTSAGTYTVVAQYTSNNNNYTNATSSPVTFTISPEALTITASNQTQTYGNVNLGSSAFGVTSGALQTGDSITGVSLSAVDINSLGKSGSGNNNVGTWGINASGATGTGGFNTTNYSISYASGTLTISPRALTVSGISGTSRAYNGSTSDALAGTASLSSNYISGDNVTLTGTGVGTLASASAGSQPVTISGYGIAGADMGDYSFTQPTVANVTISPEAITITANNQTQNYGSVSLGSAAYSITSGAVQTGDIITGVTLTAVDINSLGKSGSGNDNVGTWGINASGATGTGGFNSTNYTISYASGTLSISPLALTVSGISGTSRAYNGSTSDALAGTPSLSSNYISGDNVTLTGTGVGTLASANAGSQPVTVTGYGITGSDAGDYSFTQPTVANVTISPVALTVTANNQTQNYGSVSLGSTAYSITSGAVQTGDSITGVTLTAVDINSLGKSGSGNDNVGTWGISASAATGTGGFNSTNYSISYVSGTLTISPLALTVSGIAGTSRAYNGSTSDALTGTPVLSSNYVSGDNVTLTGTGVGTLASASAGSEPVTITGYGVSGTDTGDYSFSEPTVPNVTISKATPTITWSNPADIAPGTALSGIQLDATANVAGTSFVYTPPAGTVLSAGLGQTLSVTFTPTDTTDYSTATANVSINVWPISITPSTTSVKGNVATITINGYGFSTTAANDTVTLSGGATGTVTTATATKLTVTVHNLAAGPLTATVKNSALSSNNTTPTEQVATVMPVVTTATTSVLASAASLVINGFGFDNTTPGNNVVTFSGGVTGTVTSSTATQLTVTGLSGLVAGALTASVTSDGISSGTAVQVAKVAPVVTASTASLAANTTSVTINGYGFTTGSTVALTGGTAGAVTVVSSNQLKVAVTNLTAGSLTAVVTSSAVSSGTAVQVATVTPVITSSVANLAANVTTLTINGFGFSATASKNVLTLTNGSGGVIGTVTAATVAKLTVTLSGTKLTGGTLSATVTSNSQSSGTAVQVATVIPVVTLSTASLLANATTMTIAGFGFDTATPSNNVVTFSGGATGTVTSATSTQLTVTGLTGLLAGTLTATVKTDGASSTAAVQVAKVSPVVTSSTATLAANSTSLTIFGYGFTTGSTVKLTGGTAGKVTVVSQNELIVVVSALVSGSLTAVVTSSAVTSGTAVQVATVIPVVTPSTASLAHTATTMIIHGFGFSTTAANNVVTFSGGVTGTVTAATATTLTVTFATGTTLPLGALDASVTTNGDSSGTPVEVANVT